VLLRFSTKVPLVLTTPSAARSAGPNCPPQQSGGAFPIQPFSKASFVCFAGCDSQTLSAVQAFLVACHGHRANCGFSVVKKCARTRTHSTASRKPDAQSEIWHGTPWECGESSHRFWSHTFGRFSDLEATCTARHPGTNNLRG